MASEKTTWTLTHTHTHTMDDFQIQTVNFVTLIDNNSPFLLYSMYVLFDIDVNGDKSDGRHYNSLVVQQQQQQQQ